MAVKLRKKKAKISEVRNIYDIFQFFSLAWHRLEDLGIDWENANFNERIECIIHYCEKYHLSKPNNGLFLIKDKDESLAGFIKISKLINNNSDFVNHQEYLGYFEIIPEYLEDCKKLHLIKMAEEWIRELRFINFSDEKIRAHKISKINPSISYNEIKAHV